MAQQQKKTQAAIRAPRLRGTPRQALTAKVSPAVVEAIDAAATAAGLTRSHWIAEALHRALKTTHGSGNGPAINNEPSDESTLRVEPF